MGSFFLKCFVLLADLFFIPLNFIEVMINNDKKFDNENNNQEEFNYSNNNLNSKKNIKGDIGEYIKINDELTDGENIKEGNGGINEIIKNIEMYLETLLPPILVEKINIKLVIPISLLSLVIVILLSYIIFGFEIDIAILLLCCLLVFYIIYLPHMKDGQKSSNMSTDLPYVLRQMVTELRSGKGLHDVLSSIASSDYGDISHEFSRVIEEIKYGESTENALLNMLNRVKSDGLNRAIHQIIGTLKTGGNLSNTLNIMAEDISHDLQIKLKDYSQKLNAFIMIYTFLAILGPVIFLIMLMAASTVMGDIVPSNVVLIIYIFFFPMIVVFMGLMIKRLEPSL